MRAAARLIDVLRGNSLPIRPVLKIISQGQDNAVLDYAHFYAMNYKMGKPYPHFTISNTFSWSPEPSNIWQTKSNVEDVVLDLSQADIIWPINLDPWLLKILSRLVSDSSCLNTLPNKALIRYTADGTPVRFRCVDK